MKIKGTPGDWAFKAAINTHPGWYASDKLFLSKEEAERWAGKAEFRWPVEVQEDGSIYMPSQEELNEED